MAFANFFSSILCAKLFQKASICILHYFFHIGINFYLTWHLIEKWVCELGVNKCSFVYAKSHKEIYSAWSLKTPGKKLPSQITSGSYCQSNAASWNSYVHYVVDQPSHLPVGNWIFLNKLTVLYWGRRNNVTLATGLYMVLYYGNKSRLLITFWNNICPGTRYEVFVVLSQLSLYALLKPLCDM